MRKTAIALIVLVGLVIFVSTKLNKTAPDDTLVTASVPPAVLGESVDGIALYGPIEAGNVTLIDNLSDQLTSSEAKQKYNCKVITNAAFYTKENKHIGYFVAERKTLRDEIKSDLFNGFLTINSVNTPRITRDPPLDTVNGFQSGPILIENAGKKQLSLVRDKEARRIVAAVSGDNKLFLIALFDQNSVFSGPLLKDLPEKVESLSRERNLNIADAINLDGGSASAYIDSTVQLSELSPVGSFLCVK